MVLLAVALTASIHLEIDLRKLLTGAAEQSQPSGLTCNISTVGYRFLGRPGQEFRYAGERWVVPATGSIELLADPRRTTYTFDGHAVPLGVWARDQFGFREVPLPSPDRPSPDLKEN